MFNIKLYLILFTASFLFTNGCGKKEENVHNTMTDEQVKQMDTVKDPTSGGTQNELGMVSGMPDNYPTDVPKPKNGTAMGNFSSSDGVNVTFESDDMPKAIIDDFNEQITKSGFKKDTEEVSDQGGMITWKKEAREVTLTVARSTEKNKTTIVVTYK